MPTEAVTNCHSCGMNRLVRLVDGYWICVKFCWKRRAVLVATWKAQERELARTRGRK